MALTLGLPLLLAGCGAEEGPVWPIGGDVEPDRLSSTFGPRLQAGRSLAYDFHRGIDIPAEEESDVYAILPGEVKRAGDDPDYSDRVVQIEHCDGEGECFFSNYMHLTEPCVDVGDRVEAGEVIGLSGKGESGFPHLHFEIRAGKDGQANCVHPLRKLPGGGGAPPVITVAAVDDGDPAAAEVEVLIEAPGSDPGVVRVEIATSDRATGAAIEERAFDFEAWNQTWSLSNEPAQIDDPDVGDMHVEPAEFNEETGTYELRVRFRALTPAGQPGDLAVTARALDVHGGAGEASAP